ncbi:MAG: OsmC family protein [Thermoplasmata archaeon]
MEAFVKELKANPEAGRKHKVVEGEWSFNERTPQFGAILAHPEGETAVVAELPSFAGGWGTSPDPIQYCLYGLAACFAVTLATTAASEGVILARLRVTAENWMNLEKQMGVSQKDIIERVRFTVEAEGDVSQEQKEELLRLTEERCPGTEVVTRVLPFEARLA